MARAAQELTARLRWALPACGLLVVCACAATPPATGIAPAGAPVAPPEASFDWRPLVPMPFGTLLKSSPAPLHEVLVFQERSQPAAGGDGDSDSRDCYTVDAAPPRFIGRRPDEYLLCFEHDRLARIDASVRVTPADAEPLFARACAGWAATAAAGTPAVCEGRDGNIAFKASLDAAPDGAALISLRLTAAPDLSPTPAASGAVPSGS